MLGGYTAPIRNEKGYILSNSIAKLERINLGGVSQWLVIRGYDINNPILLFIHGGPGCSQTGAQRKYNAELEEHFTVVNWDQRGAGKSYDKNIPPETMSVDQLISDAFELVKWLRNKFRKKKIFIMGHSIGAALSLLFVQKFPELVYAYIGINQPIDRENEEKLSYQFVLDKAINIGNRKALKELQFIGYPHQGLYHRPADLVIQRTWLTKLGGVSYQKNALSINMHYLLSSHLTMKERIQFMKGFQFSTEHLWKELTGINFFNKSMELKVPVYFIMGKHDRIVHDFIVPYFNKIQAPDKKLVIFENSGHMACFEEPKKFNEFIINLVKTQNKKRVEFYE